MGFGRGLLLGFLVGLIGALVGRGPEAKPGVSDDSGASPRALLDEALREGRAAAGRHRAAMWERFHQAQSSGTLPPESD